MNVSDAAGRPPQPQTAQQMLAELDLDPEIEARLRSALSAPDGFTKPDMWNEPVAAPERWTQDRLGLLHAERDRRLARAPWKHKTVHKQADLRFEGNGFPGKVWDTAVAEARGERVDVNGAQSKTGPFLRFESLDDARRAVYLATRRGAVQNLTAALRDGAEGPVHLAMFGATPQSTYETHTQRKFSSETAPKLFHSDRHHHRTWLGDMHADMLGIIDGPAFHDVRAASKMAVTVLKQ